MNTVEDWVWELETERGENGLAIKFKQRDLQVRAVDAEILNKLTSA
ncbi:hypothetical protein GYB62_01225 [bacterium]|nr:hypothetical protein [bacterium]